MSAKVLPCSKECVDFSLDGILNNNSSKEKDSLVCDLLCEKGDIPLRNRLFFKISILVSSYDKNRIDTNKVTCF